MGSKSIGVGTVLGVAVLAVLLQGATPASAQVGRMEQTTIHAPSLAGNLLADLPDRGVAIYLPPGYPSVPKKRYPVAYLLHGYGAKASLWQGDARLPRGEEILTAMTAWLAEGRVREMILVMPDACTRLGGSWYTDSPASGKWEDFLARELVAWVDGRYRTLARPESRAVIGHSMGAYGALRLGILHPGVFGCIASLSGVYSLREEYLEYYSSAFASVSTVTDWRGFTALPENMRMLLAMAAAFAPNPARPPFFGDLPYFYAPLTDPSAPRRIARSGDTLGRFLEHDLLRLAAAHGGNLRNLQALFIDCGTDDKLILDARALHRVLGEGRILHEYGEHGGTHTSHLYESVGQALEAFSRVMAFDQEGR